MTQRLAERLKAGDPEERRYAASLIPEMSGRERVRLLLDALGDADWRVRKEATAAAIALAPDQEVLQGLVTALEPGENVGLRNAAVEAIGGFGAPAVSALAAAMSWLDADGRKLAAEALSRSAEAAALRVLGTLCRDDDPNVRIAAIEGIASVGSVAFDSASALLKKALESKLQVERLTALEGMNQLGAVVEWEVLEPLLDDPILRRAALVAAGRVGHPHAAPQLASALADPEDSIWIPALAALASFVSEPGAARQAARAALGSLPSKARRRLALLPKDSEVDLQARKNALLVIGTLGTSEAAAVAIDGLSDDRLAAEADAALIMLGPGAILELAARAKSGTLVERVACIELLGRLADDSTRAIARQAIHDAADEASPDVVRAALSALGRLGDEATIGFALRWLTSDAPVRVRHAAATALGACSSRYPDAARALARQARADQPDAAAAAVVIAVVGSRVFGSNQRTVEFLAVAASNQDPLVRRLALDALGAIDSGSAVSAVAFALTDEEPEVQLAAARALGTMRDAEGRAVGVSHLLEVIRDSLDEGLALAALEALGRVGDPVALEDLKRVAKEGTPMRAVVAVEAIGRLNVEDRYDALVEMLDHAEVEVVKAALTAMARTEDPRVEVHLGSCLAHDAWDVRRLCADLLGHRGGSSAKRLLQDRLSVEEEPLVREAIRRSLAEAEGLVGVRHTVPPPAFGGDSE